MQTRNILTQEMGYAHTCTRECRDICAAHVYAHAKLLAQWLTTG